MAPSYANHFMAQLERKLLDNASMKPLIWWRYIDDIFAIWCHGEANLKVFIADLNQAHPTIKFTAEWSNSSIPFLDTSVQLENGQLTTDLRVKPMDTHQYLAAATHATVKKPSPSARLWECAASVQPIMISGSGPLSWKFTSYIVAMNPPLSRTRSIKHLTSGEMMLSPHGLGLAAARGFHWSSRITPTSPTLLPWQRITFQCYMLPTTWKKPSPNGLW